MSCFYIKFYNRKLWKYLALEPLLWKQRLDSNPIMLGEVWCLRKR